MRKTIDPARLLCESYKFLLPIETQFSDLDVLGHLNNVSIACFYQNTRARFHMDIFDAERSMSTTVGTVVMVEANLSYLHEGFYPEPVTVGVSVASVGKSSYTLQQGLFQNNKCIGLCDSVFVFMKDKKSCALPPVERAKLVEFQRS